MRLSIKKIAFVGLFAFVFQACQIKKGEREISEGYMKYNITYLEDESTNPIISLMPSFLKMSFKNNSVLMEVEGWMGVFRSSYIKNGEKSESITLLKMMNKKYCYRNEGSNGFLGFPEYDSISIVFDDETKKILDFTCKHAKVKMPDKDLSYDVYYTNEIKIEKPNKHTFYAQIDGVLMEFQIEINGIPMHLIASELIESAIPDEVFQVPADFENMTKEELDKIFSSII
jgi:GLPGLI family protein